ncbi:MBL fold metallo-hydrolase [Sphingomonas sp. DT-51]|uniref:MBL fold metallo-hydrolase n=1 Tax=Sphingomonas sp. DT-51 TaxID=3396165 RepID=UPI003F1B76CA
MAKPPPTGVAVPLEPLVTRVLAPNASAYTYTGTQTHIVGGDDVAVIDPGPDDAAHLAALDVAIAGRPVRAILITHHHRDHSPAARALARATGAPIVGAAAAVRGEAGEGGAVDAAFDRDYAPDRVLADGDRVAGDGWTLTALATPGHTSQHLAYALEESQALFSGDHVMGWATSVISPPDGDMSEYLASLETLLARDDRVYYPGHGEAVARPRRLLRGMLGHRKQREGQIVRLLTTAPHSVAALVERMYVGLDAGLAGAAARSVLAHLIDLERRGVAAQEEGAWRII